jgi:hypothetical protein
MELMFKVRRATSPESRFQLTTDGLVSYIAAVDEMLRDRCDYAQLIRIYAFSRTAPRKSGPFGAAKATTYAIKISLAL